MKKLVFESYEDFLAHRKSTKGDFEMGAYKNFQVGDRVILQANEEEGWPEERGFIDVIEDENGMAIIIVDDQYLARDFDDGVREVDLNNGIKLE